MELWYLFCPHRLIEFNICTKFCQSISQGFRVTDLNTMVNARVVANVDGQTYGRMYRRTNVWTDDKRDHYIMPYLRQAFVPCFVKVSHKILELRTWTLGSTLGWSQMLTDGWTTYEQHTNRRKTRSLYSACLRQARQNENHLKLYNIIMSAAMGFFPWDSRMSSK